MLKRILPYVVALSVFVVGLRIQALVAVLIMLLAGFVAFSSRRYGRVAFVVAALVFTQTFTRQLIGEDAHTSLFLRIGIMALLGLCMVARLRIRPRMTIQLAGLFVYVIYMILPSTFGWFPAISYIKIGFFLYFTYGLLCCTYLVLTSEVEIESARFGVLGIAAFCIWASALLYFIPGIGYSMQVSKAAQWGISEYDALHSELMLFSGIFFHSQTLGPVVIMLFGFVICDMMRVHSRMSIGHISIALPALILAYMSRSRTALLTLMAIGFSMFIFLTRDMVVPIVVKRRLRGYIWCGVLLMTIMAIFLEIRKGTISDWIYKGMSGASGVEVGDVMSTRMGKIEENIYDFRKNPYIGKGFQTQEVHRYLFNAGIINYFSAPVEKGVMPLMILGEGGICGGVIFLAFLIVFYVKCLRMKEYALIILFVGFFAANMGEAHFFSPSGAGGDFWCVCLLGGGIIDYLNKLRYRRWTKVALAQ